MKHYKHSRTLQLLLTMLAIVIMVITVQVLPTGQLQTANAAAVTKTGNPIQQENLLSGTPNWYITNSSPLDPKSNTYVGIEGYSSVTSAAAGNTISFAVNTNLGFTA